MKKTAVVMMVLMFASASIFAQKTDYSKDPGYLDLSWTSAYSGEKGSEILVEQGLLKMLAKMAKEQSADLVKQLENLKLVRMNSFPVTDENAKQVESKINSIDKDLLGRDWERIARTKSNNEIRNIYVKTSGSEKFLGIVITTLNTKLKGASFVNVVGEIDPELIGKLAKGLNIPQLGHLNGETKKK